jgi:lipopolysaccharide/colanic/teichoic acid biosynthesis glycosyltransferase
MTVHVTNVSERVAANVDAIPIEPLRSKSGAYRAAFKRLFDISFVLLTAPFVLPFVALVALIVSLDGHSPIFRQERVGKDGRRFMLWKLRTMVPGAEDLLSDHLDCDADARSEWNEKQKLTNDPRITRLGHALRRTSIDELPQLLNVLAGDMSLVGPRPMMPNQQSLYPGRAYYKLRPGVTGPWQVSQRNEAGFSERAHYDDAYDASMSFGQDLRILIKTVFAVIRGTGC